MTPSNLFSFSFTINGLNTTADLWGNAPYSCVAIAKGFHSRSILYSGQSNTRPPIKCYCFKNASTFGGEILKWVFTQHACCSFKSSNGLIRRRSDYIIGLYCPSNRSKQIKETHTAYSAGTQYTRQSLNEK